MLDRLMGTETEYAIRYVPDDGEAHPGNQVLFDRIADAVGELVHVGQSDGLSAYAGRRYFIENGGAFNFEQAAVQGGLFEASTPECRGPAQTLLYQRAQDQLLEEAVAIAEERMRSEGSSAQLGLLKNCRDALGNL
ncbi:MAG: proteasome accessory factor PafA2 family protein, partial [Myxococcota bacterium]